MKNRKWQSKCRRVIHVGIIATGLTSAVDAQGFNNQNFGNVFQNFNFSQPAAFNPNAGNAFQQTQSLALQFGGIFDQNAPLPAAQGPTLPTIAFAPATPNNGLDDFTLFANPGVVLSEVVDCTPIEMMVGNFGTTVASPCAQINLNGN